MSEPRGILTFEELIKRVAREAGVSYHGTTGQEIAMVPADDAYNLDVCKRVVNDAIRMFISDSPNNGWRWMRRLASVTMTASRIEGTVDSAGNTTLVDATLSTTSGTADAADSTSLTDATLSATYDTDDELNGLYCYIISGTGAGSFAIITDYDASTGKITVADWLTSGGLAGGTDPIATDTFGISTSKILNGYFCYVTAGTGNGSYAAVTGFDASDGTVTVADWLDANGNGGGTNPGVGSTFAITVVETVGGDISRYPLPENFGGTVAGDIHYAANTNHASIISWCNESLIRRKRAVTIITSYPLHAAIRQLEPTTSSSSAKRRFEIIFDPQPVADDTVEFKYYLHFDDMLLESGIANAGAATTITDVDLADLFPDSYFVGWTIRIISGTGKNATAVITTYVGSTGVFTVADWLDVNGGTSVADPTTNSVYVVEPVNNLHPAGFRFDEHVLAACMAKAEMEFEDVSASYVEQYHQKSLVSAFKVDALSAPKSLGSTNLGARYYRERTWSDVEHN